MVQAMTAGEQAQRDRGSRSVAWRRTTRLVEVLAWFLAALSFAARSGRAGEVAAAPAPEKPRVGVLIRFEGTITPLNENYLYRKLDDARSRGADLVVIEIESPGGMLGPTLQMAARLRDIDWARTVAYVPKMALSGAAIMALGCDEIVMHPQAKFGDAGPIYLNEGGIFEHAPEKLRTDLARHVRDLAEAKGRPPALAEAMVDKDLKIFHCRNRLDGVEHFLREHDLDAAVRPDEWERLAPVEETLRGNFLEVNGRRAVELKIASTTVGDREELRRHLRLDSPWVVLEPSTKDTAVYVLNLPLVTGLLIVIGLVALFVELSSPGLGLGGLVSLLCFALFFWSRFLGGTSGWLEVILFFVGGVFLAVELFVLPGFGFAGVAGIGMMLVAMLMACQDFIVPHTFQELVTLARGVVVLVGSLVVFLGVVSVLGKHMRSMPLFGRLVLAAPSDGDVAASGDGKKWLDPDGKPIAAPVDENETGVYAGDWGVAQTPLRPAGRARFGARIVDVVADNVFVDAGKQVKVLSVQGNRIVVDEVAT